MKRSTKIAAFSAGVAAAGAAAIAKISTLHAEPDPPEPVPAPIIEADVDGRAFLDHLGSAVRIDTSVHVDRSRNDPAAMSAMHEFLASTYPRVHATCEREVINDQSLLFRWDGSDPDAGPIVLMAHMDVVPIEPGTEDDWAVEPFAGKVTEDHLWGRGALDDKGPLIATLEAVEHLINSGFEPVRTVYLAFGHDEEIGGSQGAQAIAETLRERGVRPWIVIDEGGGVIDSLPGMSDEPAALVKVAEKGYVDVKLTATGEGGHSSIPPKSTSAGKIAAALYALETNPMPSRVAVLEGLFTALTDRLDPVVRSVVSNLRVTGPVVASRMAKSPQTDAMIRTTTAVTMVSGGVKPNVLPQETWAVVNFRILPGDSIEAVLDHVRSVVEPDITIETYGEMISEPSRFSATDGAAWDVIETTVLETFPEAVVAPWILTGATDSRYYADIADEVYGFAPFTMESALGAIHGTDEKIRTSDADRAVSFFSRLIRRAAASQPPETV